MIDLKQAAEAVTLWQSVCFPDHGPDEDPQVQRLAKAGKLCEEAGEVMGAVIKARHDTERHAGYSDDKILSELGDVFITWLAACWEMGADPEGVAKARWDEVRHRADVLPVATSWTTSCECGHSVVAHMNESSYPTECKYSDCRCEGRALPGTKWANGQDWQAEASPPGRFAAIDSEDANSHGKICFICVKPLVIGDRPCLIPNRPADADEEAKMRAGRAYTAVADIVHEKCVWG